MTTAKQPDKPSSPSSKSSPSKSKKTKSSPSSKSKIEVTEAKLRTLLASLIDEGDPSYMTLATELQAELPEPIYEPEGIAIQALQSATYRVTASKLPRDSAILILQTINKQYGLSLKEGD